jgi:hypothetical protein
MSLKKQIGASFPAVLPEWLHHVRCLKVLQVFIRPHSIKQLPAGEGRHEAGVAAGYADAIRGKKALGSIQALRGELIVTKGAQQLTHQDISSLRSLGRWQQKGGGVRGGAEEQLHMKEKTRQSLKGDRVVSPSARDTLRTIKC